MPQTEERNINPAAFARLPHELWRQRIVLSVTLCPRSFTGISANGRLVLVEI
jgi:hypothetical protein